MVLAVGIWGKKCRAKLKWLDLWFETLCFLVKWFFFNCSSALFITVETKLQFPHVIERLLSAALPLANGRSQDSQAWATCCSLDFNLSWLLHVLRCSLLKHAFLSGARMHGVCRSACTNQRKGNAAVSERKHAVSLPAVNFSPPDLLWGCQPSPFTQQFSAPMLIGDY